MGEVGAWATIRYVLLAIVLIGLFGVAFSFGQYSVQGLVIQEMEKADQPDAKTYTKAFCKVEGGIRSCEDRLVVEIGGKVYTGEDSGVIGSGQWADE